MYGAISPARLRPSSFRNTCSFHFYTHPQTGFNGKARRCDVRGSCWEMFLRVPSHVPKPWLHVTATLKYIFFLETDARQHVFSLHSFHSQHLHKEEPRQGRSGDYTPSATIHGVNVPQYLSPSHLSRHHRPSCLYLAISTTHTITAHAFCRVLYDIFVPVSNWFAFVVFDPLFYALGSQQGLV